MADAAEVARGSERPWVPFRPGVLDEEGHVLGSRCPSCEAHFFPTRQVCSRCLAEDLEQVALSTRGTLYTYTVLHQAAPGFEVPLVLGYVDLPERVRILGQVAGLEPDSLRMGMELDLSVEPFAHDEEGQTVMGYRFRPPGDAL